MKDNSHVNVHTKPPAKKSRHYVNNKDLNTALVKYREVVQQNPKAQIPNYIGECIRAICTKLSSRGNFSGYSFKDEMILDGIENCCAAVPSYNPEKTENAFGYFTMIAWNAFIRRIMKEQKQQYIKHKNMQNSFVAFGLEDVWAEGSTAPMKNNELSNEIISKFENKLTKQRKQSKMGLEAFCEANENETPCTTIDN